MATVRHSSCRIDFDPSDVTSEVVVTISDSDGVPLRRIQIKMTHLMTVVSKMSMVMVRRDVAIARIIGEMDDELNSRDPRMLETDAVQHAKVCVVVGSHIRDECQPPSAEQSP